jgi:hypothetical protein
MKICVRGEWVGVEKVGEQEELETRKMSGNGD